MTNEASQKDDKDINAMEKTEPKKDIENIADSEAEEMF